MTSVSATRTRRQQVLFTGGLVFVVFSALITRRSLARRQNIITRTAERVNSDTLHGHLKQTVGYESALAAAGHKIRDGAPRKPKTADSKRLHDDISDSGPIVALEALGLATLNVFSWTILTLGGASLIFDISGIDDLRTRFRAAMGVTDKSAQDAEEEIEEWIASVLSRKAERENTGA